MASHGYQYPTTVQPQAAAPAAPQAAPAPPQAPTYTSPYPASPAYNAAYNTQMGLNQNVYGTTDPHEARHAGAAAARRSTQIPVSSQDRLAQTYQAGGPDAQAAYDELMRQFARASGSGAGGEGGGVSGGGSGGHGQDASGQW